MKRGRRQVASGLLNELQRAREEDGFPLVEWPADSGLSATLAATLAATATGTATAGAIVIGRARVRVLVRECGLECEVAAGLENCRPKWPLIWLSSARPRPNLPLSLDSPAPLGAGAFSLRETKRH